MSGPGMSSGAGGAGGMRGAVAVLAFVALLVGAALFGGCDLVGKETTSRGGDAAATAATSASGTSASPSPVSVPPAEPIPRGTATPTLPLPSLDKTAQNDPGAVSQAALTVLFTYDTTTDTTAQDAAVRAEPWLTPKFAASQRQHTVVGAPGAGWTTWASHKAYTTTALEAGHEETPSDQPTAAYRQWIVRYTPVGRDGWKGEPTTVIAFVTLARATANDPWRVSDLLLRS
ncbi:hypothetical protein [Yinghuangia seranimata]|uniref:hypothetical protein n=1 Tax=Yinghuangia seranimata TaxID=408067 RepID=UPI00248C03A3|nr:hypothetical protein [Yinghuangia seranimata]MDI2125834.1 hypothetical protein [Yinghuangia seranimata]